MTDLVPVQRPGDHVNPRNDQGETEMPQTPGPAADLIEHAAGIIAAKMAEPHTAPYHWAAALWEAGMLVAPGHSAAPTDLDREVAQHQRRLRDRIRPKAQR